MPSAGRCIALFPGAFRPPHRAHFDAVKNLVANPDVDEVVIVISNRCRHVPGTTKLLGTEVAERIWSIYLQGLPKVRVEVATGSAVQHALSYMDSVSAGNHLIFCVGESDMETGDSRFRDVPALASERSLSAEVIPAPAVELSCRASGLRGAIAAGERGRAQFLAGLPGHLNEKQCEAVWQVCQQGLRDLAVIGRDKLRKIIQTNQLGEIISIEAARAGKPDVVFRVGLANGTKLYIKYANDTVKDASFADPQGLKPRSRLSAERRAINWLHNNNLVGVELPEVVFFSKKTKTLVLSEVCAGGQSLADCVRSGEFDIGIIGQATRFLAACHRAQQAVTPLWHDFDSDRKHWETILGLRTSGIACPEISSEACLALEALEKASLETARNCFVNLNFTPANILVGSDRIGIIDLELCCSFGDPACDLGYFLGGYLALGLVEKQQEMAVRAIGYALDAYRIGVEVDWDAMQLRVPAFVGASILACLSDSHAGEFSMDVRRLLVSTAERLLHTVYEKNLDAGSALKDAANVFLRVKQI